MCGQITQPSTRNRTPRIFRTCRQLVDIESPFPRSFHLDAHLQDRIRPQLGLVLVPRDFVELCYLSLYPAAPLHLVLRTCTPTYRHRDGWEQAICQGKRPSCRKRPRSRVRELERGASEALKAGCYNNDSESDPRSILSDNMVQRQILEQCLRLNIRCVSVYAFSIENFTRPQEEIDDIMHLAKTNLKRLSEEG